jgi:hypothetical protein
VISLADELCGLQTQTLQGSKGERMERIASAVKGSVVLPSLVSITASGNVSGVAGGSEEV